jgi:hypothetical protein
MLLLRLSVAVALLIFSSLALAQAATAPIEPVPAAVPASHVPYPVNSPVAVARARQIAQWFISGNSAQLWALFSPELQKQWQSSVKMVQASKRMATAMGSEKKIALESAVPDLLRPTTDYSRLSQFTKSSTQLVTLVALTEQGTIAALVVHPVPDAPTGQFSGYKDQARFRLPFSGQWMVYQGGRSFIQNAYLGGEEERYTMDFVLLKDGRPYSGDGTKNEQYYCFGQPVLAPADGTVVRVRNTSADNEPGKATQEQGMGNVVIIAQGNNEYSVLSELKQNSITVKRGDKVKQGDPVAACGNSGASPAPHIQFRLQNSHGYPLPLSLPIQFVDYIVDGKPVESGEPVRGQMVSNAGQATAAVGQLAPSK